MNIHYLNRSASSLHRNVLTTAVMLAAGLLGFAGALPSPATAKTLEEASIATPVALEQAAKNLRADYRQQQWKRLAQKQDRDSLIAAVLLGMPNDAEYLDLPKDMENKQIDGNVDVEQHLAKVFGHDPLALFTLALSCQMQTKPCAHPEHYDALVRIAPDNAVHWLMLPNGAAPSDAQLHAAAAATQADTHLRDVVRILRTALANQPAPSTRPGTDPRELALLLRRNAVDQVMLAKIGTVLPMCKGVVAQRRDDCVAVGRLFVSDRSGSIVSRMIGSAMLRRLFKGMPEEIAAKQLRREYVWMGEQQESNSRPNWELLQNEVVTFGQWEASKRDVERLGASQLPPASWIPKNPQTLLLTEERTPVAPAK